MTYYRKTIDRSPDALRPTERQVLDGMSRRELETLALQSLRNRIRSKQYQRDRRALRA